MDKEQIDELIEELLKSQREYKDLLDGLEYDDNKPEMPYFHKIYPLTNECLNEYFAKLNLKDKKVLTVGSSGDQILYSLAYGAKDITHIDINPFAKFYIDLKIASIKKFDHKNFKRFFNYRLMSSNIIKSKLYKEVSDLLPEDSKYFWDNIFSELDSLKGFTHGLNNIFDHYVYDEKQFNDIKSALNGNYSLKFQCLDIANILNLVGDKKYDAIFLSNIYDYVDKWKRKQPKDEELLNKYTPQQIEFFDICKGLLNSLNPNGTLQVQYGFTNAQTLKAKWEFEEVFKDYQVYRIRTKEGGPVIIQNTPREKEMEG